MEIRGSTPGPLPTITDIGFYNRSENLDQISAIEISKLRRRRYLQYPHPFFPANTVRRGDASLEARPYTDF